MSILTWIEDKKRLKVLNAPKYINSSSNSSKGLWTRCDKCGVILYIKHLKENQRVCFGCSYHLQMMSQERIENLLDKVPVTSYKARELRFRSPHKLNRGADVSSLHTGGVWDDATKSVTTFSGSTSVRENMVSTWRPLDETVSPCDPLKFLDQKHYTDRLRDAQERTGLQDAIQTGTGMIDGVPVALAVMDFSFMGGSMGSVVGEKITRLIEYATQEGLTLIIVSASGGARMQEGVFSLMQMAKISSALQIYQACAKLLYISILTSPTTGGVTASFAMLGDIIFAEPKALIAFAGRRVIEQTLCEDLPDDFQTSEYMLHHGLVDLIVPRRFLRQALSESIRLYQNAPFKKVGRIPFGVQNPITFLTEEKVRRQWGRLAKQGTKAIDLTESTFNELNLFSYKSTQNVKAVNTSQEELFALSDFSLAKNSDNTLDIVNSPSLEKLPKQIGTLMPYREILTSFQVMLNLFSPITLSSHTEGVKDSRAQKPIKFNRFQAISNIKDRSVGNPVRAPYCLEGARQHTNRRFVIAVSCVPLLAVSLRDKKMHGNTPIAVPLRGNKRHVWGLLSPLGFKDFQSRASDNGLAQVIKSSIWLPCTFGGSRSTTNSSKRLQIKTRHVQSRQITKDIFSFRPEKSLISLRRGKKCVQNFAQLANLGTKGTSKSRLCKSVKQSQTEGLCGVRSHATNGINQNGTLKNYPSSSSIIDLQKNNTSFNFSGEKIFKRSNNLTGLNLGFTKTKSKSPSERLSKELQENHINFLNQAIELAATESVKWRAFYIDQQL